MLLFLEKNSRMVSTSSSVRVTLKDSLLIDKHGRHDHIPLLRLGHERLEYQLSLIPY